MNRELEQRLVALGAVLDVPPAPDLVSAVLGRLPERRRRLRRASRRAIVLALAGVLLVAGAAMAITPTRNAILQVFGLRGVRIERLRHLPEVPGESSARGAAGAAVRLGLGRRIPLVRARHAATFRALLPSGSAAAYFADDVPGGRISLLIGRVLIIEFRGTAAPFIFKLAGAGTTIKPVRVNGGQGFYLGGAPHMVIFREQNGEFQTDRVRLAGNVLIWQQGPLTLRIEGTRTLAQAMAIARSLR